MSSADGAGPPSRSTGVDRDALKASIAASIGKLKSTEDEVARAKASGTALFQLQKYEEAIDAYSKAIKVAAVEQSSTSSGSSAPCAELIPGLFANRALCYLQLGRSGEAFADCAMGMRTVEAGGGLWAKFAYRKSVAGERLGLEGDAKKACLVEVGGGGAAGPTTGWSS